MADATATQNKALQHTAGTRDRELAAAAVQLAQSRGAYEISWANLNLESSEWHLDQSALPINSADDGTITFTPDAGTKFVPGWFSVPRLSEAGSASTSTSTGFNATDLDQYFTAGLMPDMPGADPVTSGKASRDDSRFTSALGIPAQHEGNETKPAGWPLLQLWERRSLPGGWPSFSRMLWIRKSKFPNCIWNGSISSPDRF